MVDSRPIRSGSRPLDTFFRSPLDSLWGLKPIGPSARAIERKHATTAMLLNVESVHFSSRLTRFAFDSLPPPFHGRIQPPWITRGTPFQSTAPVLSRGSPLLGQASTIFFNPWPSFFRSTNRWIFSAGGFTTRRLTCPFHLQLREKKRELAKREISFDDARERCSEDS